MKIVYGDRDHWHRKSAIGTRKSFAAKVGEADE